MKKDTPISLSSGQELVWHLLKLNGSTPALHQRGGAWLHGELDPSHIRAAVRVIAERHEALRVRFIEQDGRPLQLVAPATDTGWRMIDLGGAPMAAREDQALALARQEVVRPFDIEAGLLWRVCLVQIDPAKHLLILTMHSLVCDGAQTIERFFEELFALCGGSARERSPVGRAAAEQTHGLARERASCVVRDEQTRWWREELAGTPRSLEIARTRARTREPSLAAGTIERRLDPELVTLIKAFGQQEHIDLHVLLLASLLAVLHRYCDQNDVLSGTLLPERNPIDSVNSIGHGSDAVVIRGRFEGNPCFRELLEQVRQTIEGARAHRDVSWKEVVDALAPTDARSLSSLFQLMFTYNELRPRTWRGAALSLTFVNIELPFTSHELSIFARKIGGSGLVRGDNLVSPAPRIGSTFDPQEDIFLRIDYSALFDEGTVSRLLDHWAVLLRAAVTNPGHRISQLPLLTERERREILVEWNDTKSDYPRDACIHEVFEAHAERTPDAVAIAYEGTELTYRQLNCRANRLAHHLIKRGVDLDTKVGILGDQSLNTVVGMLAILKAGGAYVPLDPRDPPNRLRAMLEDVDVRVLLGAAELSDKVQFQGPFVALDARESPAFADPEDHRNPIKRATATSTAYVLFTSGSTGRPKGVAVRHRGVVRLVVNTNYVDFSPIDRILHISNLSFDASTFEIWSPLLNGACLVIMKRAPMLNPETFASSIVRERITGVLLTTALFHEIARAVPHAMHGLRFVLFGGEACDPKWVRSALTNSAPGRLVNAYGPTENTVITTCQIVREVPEGATSIPIGRPVSNTRIYVLDRYLNPVPVGVAGELYTSGDGLAGGYIHRPDLTDERFLPDPFSNDPDERLYKTGDRVCYLEDGSIEFLGRIDDQVKLRGFRIELAEVEAALEDHPDVRSVVVIAREDRPGDKRLVAYLVPRRDPGPSTSALRDFLRLTLPDHMVPSAFVQLAELPLTPNGKIDRRALPAPDTARPELSASFIGPRSNIEEAHAKIWSEVLSVDRVGVHDDFFSLGGHSLRAIQIATRIRQRFNVDIPLQKFFAHPTIADLATWVEQAKRSSDAADLIPKAPRTSVVPMSFAQERLWFLYLLAPQSSAYNCPAAFTIRGLLDTASLEQGLRELIRRHESLRTHFLEVNGRAMQVIEADRELHFSITDLSGLPRREREAELQRQIAQEARQPFDLRRGPLFRASLLRSRWNEHVLLLNLHHIITDGWSMKILFKELEELYRAGKQSAPSPLDPLPLQYADFASFQRRKLEAGGMVDDLAWGKNRLAGAPFILELPTDRPRPPIQTFRGASVTFTIGRPDEEALRSLSNQEGATASMILLAAFVALLHRYTGQEDLLVGTPHANRDRIETNGIIGFFANTLVIRCNLAGDPSFRDLVVRVRDASVDAYEHATLPFERLVSALEPERDLGRNAVIQVMFAPQVGELPRLGLEGVHVETLAVDAQKSAFDLTMFLWESPAGFVVTLEYSTELFDAETITRLGEHLRTLLHSGVAEPGQKVSELPLLSEAERHHILVEWNHTRREYPRDACVHELFEAQAARTPDAIAAAFEGREITYASLNHRANCLARRLRAQGVGPGARVGVLADRSFEVLSALLGILKAGGAYVPLDPEHPTERLMLMLEDAGVSVVVAKRALSARLPFTGAVIEVEDTGNEVELSENLPCVTTAEDVAYVMFTSGSSGRPKGPAIPHRAIVRLVLCTNYVEFTPLDRVMHASNLSFDASTFEIWGALLNGSRLVLIPRETLLSPRAFAAQVRREQLTIMFLSTALFHRLAAVIPDAFRDLRYLVVGGDVLDPKWARKVLEQGPPEQLVNGYGPTENTTFSTAFTVREVPAGITCIPIGKPVANSFGYVLDARLQPVPVGVPGELYVGGDGVARGYVNRSDQKDERFMRSPFTHDAGAMLYRTGDRARYLRDGTIEFLGRMDAQIKVRGFRIEPGEIEAALELHPDVRKALVLAREDESGEKHIVAYMVPESGLAPSGVSLRGFLKRKLPDYMLPPAIVTLPELPLTPNGKVDHRALPAPEHSAAEPAQSFAPPRSEVEETLAAIWCEVLELPRIGIDDPFFERGGDSLRLTRVQWEIHERLGREVGIVSLFQHPTIRQLAEFLLGGSNASATSVAHLRDMLAPQAGAPAFVRTDRPLSGSVAIIGMVGRFPGAPSTQALWELLRDGREGIRPLTPQELQTGRPDGEATRSDGFVPICSPLDAAACFDAEFFGYSPLDARLMDPQQRVFLECAWAALEDAGYDPARFNGSIGMFAGAGIPRYWIEHVASGRFRPGTSSEQRAMTGNPWQFLATQTAYKLGLRGPALNLQTACSTSLVAVHLACQSLLARESDMALAGGVSIFSLDPAGYLYEDGGILSPDGRCRPFDAQARGTVPGSGVALVVLRRLEDALAAGDTIHAVIRGSAINNDGSKKVSYSAPGVQGQRDVIAAAHAAAGVSSDSITFVEAHGTGTPMGDPIEAAALAQAFRQGSSRSGYCALGSLKSNIGHLDSAAGVAGLVKAAMAIKHGVIPATLHFEHPNPAIGLEDSPFFVNAESIEWRPSDGPRRAGVSSFGIGGTNAHAILEQAPDTSSSGPSRPWQILLLSARTAASLAAAGDQLADHLLRFPGQPLADVAFTLQQGRAVFGHRRAVVSATSQEAAAALSLHDPRCCSSGVITGHEPKLVFMFPGAGVQQPNMGLELYRHESVYRGALDLCAALFTAELGLDIRTVLFPKESALADSLQQLERPSLNMATIFSTEYALVQVLLSWGLKPAATTGHSLGEYAAACLAGVLGLEDAVALVALRGQLLDKMPDAAMLAVPLSEAALSNRLRSELSIAAINGSENCVVSGPLASVESLRVALAQDGIEARRLPIALASHSAMVDPVADLLGERAAKMTLRLPRIPIVSNVTGSLLSEADARDPGYWGRHLRRTVRFADGLATLLKDPNHVFVEVGPGRTLATLAQIQPLSHAERLVVTTMRHQGSSRTDMETLLRSLGSLWCAGVSIDWDAFTHNERRQRVPLPTYPFERKHHVLKSTSEKEYPPLRLSPLMPVREHAPASRSPLHEEPASTASAMDRSSTEPPQPGSHAVNDVESVLAGIWQELLGVESVHADDNFFDCGGDSLIAVQLRANVKSRLNTHVSLHAMIEHPTFAGLLSAVRNAATILPTSVAPPGEQVSSGSKDVRNERESRPARRRSAVHAEEDEGAALAMSLAPPLIPPLATREKLMVRLADGAPGKAPLFLVQPVGGTVYTYLELQRHLRGDRPIYAFRASGMEPGEPIYTDIPAMASRCLEEVLSVQPEGPYLLGGHSGGGTIAYEMACQLADRGPASTLVWMADSGFTTQYQRMNVTGIEHVLEALSAFKDIAPKIWRSFTIALADDSVLREIVVANYKALASYNPKRTTADVVYIRARERDAVLDKHPEVGWMDLVDGDFAAHNAPGNHLTMLDRPFAATLARIVQRHVDQFLSTHPLAAT